MYPEYNKKQLIIAGESYAGKYIPTVAKKVQDWATNEWKKPVAQQSFLQLSAILMGDPLTNPIPQRMSRNKIAQGVGIVDQRHNDLIATFNRRCLELASSDWSEGDDECSATIDFAIDVSG